jgi:hypothetical protein
MFAEQDPGSIGPDLTRVSARIRRDWFDRYLQAPTRAHPGTPMPAIFPKNQPATLTAVLDGDAFKQRDALWTYFALGKDAPDPKPPPPLPVRAPSDGPLIAQMPARLPNGKTIESITLLYSNGDCVVYDLGRGSLNSAYAGAQILRSVQGRLRTNSISGSIAREWTEAAPIELSGPGPKKDTLRAMTFLGYDREKNGVRVRHRLDFPSGVIDLTEMIESAAPASERKLTHRIQVDGIPNRHSIVMPTLGGVGIEIVAIAGKATVNDHRATIEPNGDGQAACVVTYPLPPARWPPEPVRVTAFEPGPVGGSLTRPGHRAIAYPRPKTVNGDDLVMPGALAINPRDGRVFCASLKSGAIYVLRDPSDDGRNAQFEDYAGGIFQDCLAMLAEPDALYVMHRRNFTRITADKQGKANTFDRVAALPQGIADSYDYAYGLVRDRAGAFVYSFAPYADTKIPGAGGALRLVPGRQPEEVAFGFRNPLGWCTNPDGEIFFTDNQGEWVATNKLCHVVPGRYYGFPNPSQRQHTSKPAGRAAVWVPYSWAHSINGVTCDTTGGKFGPFAGQFFLAELVFGGAIIRTDLERVNGEYQGACFPFWGQGLLGPLTLAFDPKGRLFVGSITEPGWMAQPDRGALYRIDFTGEVPFEIKSIRIRPHGFRLVFTRAVSPESARELASYRIESFRYEYTGAYGSPELDRAAVEVTKVDVAPDGLSAEVTTGPPVKDRVYLIQANGIRSAAGERLVHPTGAYTVNEVPAQ